MVNKVILIGNLGKDPEIKVFENGKKAAKFPLATTKRWKNKEGEKQESTEWHTIKLWDAKAELAEKYLSKGDKVYIEGEIQYKTWENNAGEKKYWTEIAVREMNFLTPKSSSNGQAESQPASTTTTAEPDDDLPF